MVEKNLKFWPNRVLEIENQFVMGINQVICDLNLLQELAFAGLPD